MESTAKLFRNGRSKPSGFQKSFVLAATEVKIRKEGEKVILEPIEKDKWPDGFWNLLDPIRHLKFRSQCHRKNFLWISRRPSVSA